MTIRSLAILLVIGLVLIFEPAWVEAQTGSSAVRQPAAGYQESSKRVFDFPDPHEGRIDASRVVEASFELPVGQGGDSALGYESADSMSILQTGFDEERFGEDSGQAGSYQGQDLETNDLQQPTTDNSLDNLDEETAQVGLVNLDLQAAMLSPILKSRQHIPLSLNEALVLALENSPLIKEFQFDALEFQQVAGQELGEFDYEAFVESSFQRNNDPVNNNFNVADDEQFRIRSQNTNLNSGLRRRTETGGQIEFSQSLDLFDDDSGTLLPPDQARTQFSVNFSQELLRDSGRKVVMNQVLVANALAEGEAANSTAQIVSHLNDVADEYWNLFSQRGRVVAAYEQVKLASTIVQKIEKRVELDGEKNLVFQARTALNQRSIDYHQAIADAKSAQDRLVRLIGAARLMDPFLELLPSENPIVTAFPVDLRTEMHVALQNRAEIQQSFASIQAAQLTHHLTLNQLLPRLTFQLESGLSGLNANYDLPQAYASQFNNSPSFGAGFAMEVRLGNRTAKFRNREAELALLRSESELQSTIQGVELEVKLAYRNLEAVGSQLEMLQQIIDDTYQEITLIQQRTEIAPRQGDIPSVQLNLVLDALLRLANAKNQYLDAVGLQQRSLIDMKRATGTLVQSDVLLCDMGPACFNHCDLAKDLKESERQDCAEVVDLQNQLYHRAANGPGCDVKHNQ